ncbi:hypothetical protein MRX96_007394 [Rhipicephalus microplus]
MHNWNGSAAKRPFLSTQPKRQVVKIEPVAAGSEEGFVGREGGPQVPTARVEGTKQLTLSNAEPEPPAKEQRSLSPQYAWFGKELPFAQESGEEEEPGENTSRKRFLRRPLLDFLERLLCRKEELEAASNERRRPSSKRAGSSRSTATDAAAGEEADRRGKQAKGARFLGVPMATSCARLCCLCLVFHRRRARSSIPSEENCATAGAVSPGSLYSSDTARPATTREHE